VCCRTWSIARVRAHHAGRKWSAQNAGVISGVSVMSGPIWYRRWLFQESTTMASPRPDGYASLSRFEHAAVSIVAEGRHFAVVRDGGKHSAVIRSFLGIEAPMTCAACRKTSHQCYNVQGRLHAE
jgi:hypothetical protein